MTYYREFLAHNWPLLQQAALYRPDPNPTFGNPAFEAASFRVLIVRLSPFRDVDRSTPHLFLFQAVRRALPDAYIDMAFFPPQYDRERLLAAGAPLLVGTQSWRGIEDFDVVLISNAYTLELINLPYLLHHSGAPLLASARDGDWPPLILGGSNALAAQAIVTETGDCVADALFFGEGEREVETLIRVLAENAALPKRERLLRAAALVTGLWVACSASCQLALQAVRKAVCTNPNVDDLLTAYPLLDSSEAATAKLQVNYGCPAFCTFCFEGYERKPYRELTAEAILAAARQLKQQQVPEEVDLYSFNFNTHQDILALLLSLNRLFDRVSFKSQRVDVLATLPGLLEAEVIADKRSFTLGIEGVSRRMRAFLHKSLADAEIESVLARLLRQKIREIKLFYILTGHETEADLDEFRDFVSRLKAVQQRANRGVRIIFSFGLLVRMPFTPLRYDRLFLDEAEWRQVVGPVKSACETNGFEFRLAAEWNEYAASQVLALGGHWLHEPVLALARQGHCYDIALTPGYWDALRAWMEDYGQWNDAFLGEKGPEYAFPMAFVRSDVPPRFLYQQYQQALAGADAGYCLGSQCLACGACTDAAQRAAITAHAMRQPGGTYLRDLEDVMRTKWRLKPVYARVWLPPEVAGRDPAWINAWVMQTLLAQYPALLDNLLAVEESLFTTKDNRRRYANLHGETIVALKAWDTARLVEVMGRGSEGESGGVGEGVWFLGWLDRFEVGTFTRLEATIALPSAHFPDAGPQLRRFLHAAYAPVNVRRVGEGYVFDVPDKALKKKLLFAGEFTQDETTFTARLIVGPKFELLDYLRSFSEPERWREAHIEVRALWVVG
ncbi:MAG TPA: radical SAM protein [Anaerolineae bacterium]|nr:radical SAM protein [Anaerolineae bacterium]HQI84231.1 radical SAM protein [Anaerolineae bacterium]